MGFLGAFTIRAVSQMGKPVHGPARPPQAADSDATACFSQAWASSWSEKVRASKPAAAKSAT